MSFNSAKTRLLGNPWKHERRVVEHSIGDKAENSHLSAKELEEFRRRLIDNRHKLAQEVATLQNKAISGFVAAGSDGSSVAMVSEADKANDIWEQALTFSSIENKRSFLREIDAALERIERKTYGICMATDKAISKSLLCGMPWAKYNYNS